MTDPAPMPSPRRQRALAATALCVLLLAASLVLAPGASAVSAILQVTVGTAPAASLPGTTGAVTMALKNVGDATAYRIQATLDGVEGGILVNQTVVDLGALGPGDQSSASPYTFHVPDDAVPGFYHLTFHVDFSFTNAGKADGGSFSSTATIAVRAAPAILVRSITPDHVQPGQDVHANLTLLNDGPAAFTNVAVVWSSPDGTLLPLGQGTTSRIARLDPHASTTVPIGFTTSPNAPPATYVLRVAIAYVDAAGTPFNGTSSLGVRIFGSALDTGLTRAPTLRVTALNLTTDSVTLAFTNTQATPVTGVEVRLLERSTVRLTDADAAVFALIAPGDFAKTTFGVARVAGTAPAAYVQVVFLDSQGVSHTELTRVDLAGVAVPFDQGTVVGLTVAAVLAAEALVAALAWGVRRSRRRRRQARQDLAADEEAFMRGDPAPAPAAPPALSPPAGETRAGPDGAAPVRGPTRGRRPG